MNHGIHADEVAATQTAMETAYALASDDSPQTRAILDNVVVVMIPSHNPDGCQRVTEWYRKTLGTKWEGQDPPFLYNHYTGHDNNRDWYMFSQTETRLTVEHEYAAWWPQIVHDIHQMGARAARLFLPPYVDPWEPNVDPALVAAANGLGAQVAARLTADGHPGVVIHAVYDAWTPARAWPHTHGGVRLLSESAEARMATPVDVPFESLQPGIGYDPRVRSWNFPLPWPGGHWRLRDIMDDQKAATRAILEDAAARRAYWLRMSYGVNRRAAERTSPYAFVVPGAQGDPVAEAKLLEVMRRGQVEVQRAKAPFTAGGRTFLAGSHVILMAQPYGAFAKTLLERQRYPDLRPFPGGPIQRPYDVTAHTLPLLLGVDVVEEAAPFAALLEPMASPGVAPGSVEGRGRWLALGHRTNDLVAVGRLLRAKVPVRWTEGPLFVPASARGRVEALARELGISARAVADAPAGRALRLPRLGVYQSWRPSMDEGWTRYVLDQQVGLPYETLHDRDLRSNISGRYDVIVLPDQSPNAILNGHPPGTMPDEYVGGIGKEGVERLKSFVEAGGTLVALNEAALLPIREMGLGVTDTLAAFRERPREAGQPPEFYCPGAILQASVAAGNPLVAGLDATTPLWFEQSPAFEVGTGTAALTYTDANPLLSGWLLGGEKLRGKAALVDVPLGKGHVVLFGFRPQYRAQSRVTYVPFLNAIYLSAARE